ANSWLGRQVSKSVQPPAWLASAPTVVDPALANDAHRETGCWHEFGAGVVAVPAAPCSVRPPVIAVAGTVLAIRAKSPGYASRTGPFATPGGWSWGSPCIFPCVVPVPDVHKPIGTDSTRPPA